MLDLHNLKMRQPVCSQPAKVKIQQEINYLLLSLDSIAFHNSRYLLFLAHQLPKYHYSGHNNPNKDLLLDYLETVIKLHSDRHLNSRLRLEDSEVITKIILLLSLMFKMLIMYLDNNHSVALKTNHKDQETDLEFNNK